MENNLSLQDVIPADNRLNSVADMLERSSGQRLVITGTLNGNNESVTNNMLKVIGTVLVISSNAEITRADTLTNLTNVYPDLYDGAVAVDIAADGATLSGLPVGTVLIKELGSVSPLTVIGADQARVTEPASDKKAHQPFLLTQKSGVDTFIRFHYTTTDTPIDAELTFYITYIPIDGGSLELL